MRRSNTTQNSPWSFAFILVVIALVVTFFGDRLLPKKQYSFSLSEIPEFSGEPYVVLYENQPQFTEEDITEKSYEYYSQLDVLGRCGYAMACVGRDLMPSGERESISSVKPTGWVQAQYDWVDGENLYNRCHLLGFQLTGENANELNLITGTRYLNVEGMLPFENVVADYVKETDNHVLYRITPIFAEEELVARGVQMEAWSVEDNGEGICFNVYVYNNQPGVTIDYLTGNSYANDTLEEPKATAKEPSGYILNTGSHKFHSLDCEQGRNIKESNREIFEGDLKDLLQQGYTAAGCCNP